MVTHCAPGYSGNTYITPDIFKAYCSTEVPLTVKLIHLFWMKMEVDVENTLITSDVFLNKEKKDLKSDS